MVSAIEIRVPFDNVNDETVKLTAWLAKNGEEVKEGQLVAEVETSKALVEMVAPTAGKLWLQAEVGQEVRVGSLIAYITANGSGPPQGAGVDRAAPTESAPKPIGHVLNEEANLPEGTSFSRKALDLLKECNIQPSVFAGRGIVREQDVQEYLSRLTSSNGHGNLHAGLKGISLDEVTLPPLFFDRTNGMVDAVFLEKLRSGPREFGKLPPEEKCELYRKHGAQIGDGAQIGERTVIISPQIVLGAGAKLEEDSVVNCRERFLLGALASFGRNLNVRGGSVVIGEDVWAGQNIRIGGGGHADPWSLLCVGDNAYLGDDLYVNICRAVLIGAGAFLTQRSIVMTHNVGHSILEGFENRFAPVILGDYSQVGMLCTIYAGSTIGRRAIVGSNSYVISSIPAGKLALGVPARVIRDAARTPDRPRQLQIVNTMMREYHELLRLKGHEVRPVATSPQLGFIVAHAGRRSQLVFQELLDATDMGSPEADETVVWTFEQHSETPPESCTVMDLLAKRVSGPSTVFANSTREFLRKKGIRCKPTPWRYRGGLI